MRAQLVIGLAGSAVLCVVPLAVHLRTPGGALPLAQLPVGLGRHGRRRGRGGAAARGAVERAEQWRGATAALILTTEASGLRHVPLYGWDALPLDLAVGLLSVGLLLRGLRMAAGGWGSAAVAHTVADLAGWWLR